MQPVSGKDGYGPGPTDATPPVEKRSAVEQGRSRHQQRSISKRTRIIISRKRSVLDIVTAGHVVPFNFRRSSCCVLSRIEA